RFPGVAGGSNPEAVFGAKRNARVDPNRDFAGGGVVMGRSRHPQKANNYKAGIRVTPPTLGAEPGNAVWYYELPGRLEFHLSTLGGHISFSVQRSKLLKSLKRIEPKGGALRPKE
ncbi:hypothetical protein LCGC14_2910770, partial [marine sediment metagenome]